MAPAVAQRAYYQYPTGSAVDGSEIFGPIRQRGSDVTLPLSVIAPVRSVNTQVGAVTITPSSIGAALAVNGALTTPTITGGTINAPNILTPTITGANLDSTSTIAGPGTLTSSPLAGLFSQTYVVPDWYKQTADGTDDMPSIIRATATGLPVHFECRHYQGKSPAVFNSVQVQWRGCGWQELTYTSYGVPPAQGDGWGTWIDEDVSFQTSAGGANGNANLITISSPQSSGSTIQGIGFTQVQPIPVPGQTSWTPNLYNHVILINGIAGMVELDHIMLRGITNGINTFSSGRTTLRDIKGQVFNNMIAVDNAFDVNKYVDIYQWPFWADNTIVEQYQQSHLSTIISDRSDTPFINRFFSIFGLSGISFGVSSNGVTTGAHLHGIQCDFTQVCLYVQPGATGVQFQADMVRSFGQSVDRGGYMNASLAGTVLTVNYVTSNYVKVGQTIVDAATGHVYGVVVPGGTGTGGAGTYNMSTSNTVAATTLVGVAPTTMIPASVTIQVDGSVYDTMIGSVDNFGSDLATLYLSNATLASTLQIGAAAVDHIELASPNTSFLLAGSGPVHQVQMSSTPMITGTKPTGWRWLNTGSTAVLTAPTTAVLTP